MQVVNSLLLRKTPEIMAYLQVSAASALATWANSFCALLPCCLHNGGLAAMLDCTQKASCVHCFPHKPDWQCRFSLRLV